MPGIPLTKPDLITAIRERNLKSVSAVFNALASGRDDPASKPGLASLLRTLWPDEYEDERDARFINDRVHANIQHDGTFSVVPRIYGGVTSSDELRRIADVADKYQARHGENYRRPTHRSAGHQEGRPPGSLARPRDAEWSRLHQGLPHLQNLRRNRLLSLRRRRFHQLGIKIEKRFQGIESPHKMKLATSGCPRNCAEATVKDIGAVAVENGWQVYVGGAAGATVRAADLLATVKTHDEVLTLMGRFMQYYRENARYAERSYGFVERVGIERLKALLLTDSEETARLDREIEAAVAAYRDPWAEGSQPYHPTQFADAAHIETQPEGLAN